MSNNISRRWTQSLPVSTLSPSSPFSLSCPETHQQQTKCSGARGGDSRSVTVVSFITCIHLAKEKRMEKRRFFRSGFDMQDFHICKTFGTTYMFLIIWYSSSSHLKVYLSNLSLIFSVFKP
ncbi:BnaCnng73900D, partial [Brassica napus]